MYARQGRQRVRQTGRQADRQINCTVQTALECCQIAEVCVAYEVGEFERLSSPCCLIIIALLNQQSK